MLLTKAFVRFLRRLGPAIVAPILWAAPLPVPAESLAISCGSVGIELALCQASAQAWSERTGHPVRVVSTPNSATERLALYQQWLASGARDVDVYQIDVIWPGLLARHFIDLRPYSGGSEDEHFPAIIENDTVDGRLVALPLYADVGLLYYRRDLLERHGRPVPRTWRELGETAAFIQTAERIGDGEGDGEGRRLWGYVYQAKTYEGLTCNALEWFAGSGGGTIVDAHGRITVANAENENILQLVSAWTGTIAPEGVLNYAEEEVRGVFQAGQAVFMRNWPYAWALLQGADSPVRGRVGVALLPHGGAVDEVPAERAASVALAATSGADGQDHGAQRPEHAHAPGSRSTLGGWQLAVSRYSRHPALAADLVRFMTSAAEQKRRAIEGGYNPTRPALYEDPEILAAQPFIGALRVAVAQAVARPSRVTRGQYNRVSVAVANAVHDALSGRASAAQALADLDAELHRVKRRGWR